MRYRTRRTASRRSGSSSGGGTRYGIRASRIFRFARTSRCARVGSGTRKARAISGVVSPPRVRSVSATRVGLGVALELLGLLDEPLRATDPVDGRVASRGGDPRSRVARDAMLGPGLERLGEGVLDRLLGEVEVAE